MAYLFDCLSLKSFLFLLNSFIVWMICLTIQLAIDGLASISAECNLLYIAI